MPRHPATPVQPVPFERGQVEEALTRLLPSEKIEQFAREAGFIESERKVQPVALLWVLVLHFGTRLTRSLAELKRGYDQRLGLATITYPGWYLRFTPELSRFLKRCLEHALGELAHEPGRELDPKLAAFEDIFLKDSTVVRLHASLATKWPATRSRKIAAGVKVDTLVSVRANGPKTLALVGQRTPEVKLLRVGPWVKNRILLANLGFYSHRLFVKIVENGGSFVSRAKASADPLFVRSYTVRRGARSTSRGNASPRCFPASTVGCWTPKSSSPSSDGSTTAVALPTPLGSGSWRCGTRRTESTTPTSGTSARRCSVQRRWRASTGCAGRSS
jgi:hypothetical protein